MRRARPLVAILAVALTYYAAARLGQLTAIPPGNVTAVWLPSGIALAALLHLGVRVWPGVWLGAFFGNVWAFFDATTTLATGLSLAAGIGIACGSSLQAYVGARLIRRLIGPGSLFDRAQDPFKFAGIEAVCCLLSPTIGVTSLCLGGFAPWTAYAYTWWTWWLGDYVGILVVTPLLLTWSAWPRFLHQPRRLMEVVFLGALLGGAALLAFGVLLPRENASYPLPLVLLPLLLWATLRFGLPGVVSSTSLLSAIAIWATVKGIGPFVRATLSDSLLSTQAFAGMASIIGLALAGALTERQRAEEDLRETEQKLRAILDHSPAIIFLKDTAARYLLVNRQFERVFHVTQDQVVGNTDEALFPAEPGGACRANDVTVLQTGEPMEFEEVAVYDDGPHTLLVHKFPLRDASGAIYAVCGIATDITERRKLEDQLRQAQKMDAIGRLAGGIAHDFNNLLTVITGYSDLLLRTLPTDTAPHGHVEQMRQAGARAVSLTQQLLAFSRRQVLQPRVLDLNAVVRGIETLLTRLLGEHIRVVLVPCPDLGAVKADPGQIEQVLMNLALNARDAMPRGGILTFETANVVVPPAGTSLPGDLPPGPYVRLTVRDTGVGMDATTQAHIFEPFFTTKPQGQGTGLGLSTVYGIVKQSGGTIQVESEVGCGTTFTMYLPRVQAPTEPGDAGAPTPQATGGSETVLLVEDEAGVRTLARTILEGCGYKVLEACDGTEALPLCREHRDSLHLIITDVVMPGMGGRELAERAAALCPRVKVLYMSGYTDDAIVHHGVREAETAFLAKPFTPATLAQRVREVLDSPLPGHQRTGR